MSYLVKEKFGFIKGVDNVIIKPNFCVLLPHRRNTTVSLETTPFYLVKGSPLTKSSGIWYSKIFKWPFQEARSWTSNAMYHYIHRLIK